MSKHVNLIFKGETRPDGTSSVSCMNDYVLKEAFPGLDTSILKISIDYAKLFNNPPKTWCIASVGERPAPKVVQETPVKKGRKVVSASMLDSETTISEPTAPSSPAAPIIDNDIIMIDNAHLNIVNWKPLFMGSIIFVRPGSSDNPTQDQVEYTFAQMLLNPEEDIKKTEEYVRKLTKLFNDTGLYKIDAEKIINPPLPEDPEELNALMKSMPAMEFIKRAHPVPKVDKTGFHIKEDTWRLLIRNILKGVNTLIVGPTGF